MNSSDQLSKQKQSIIKLPSNPLAVTPKGIWGFIQAIAKTGDTFTKKQLTDSGVPSKSDDVIIRVLSYLKYLGIVEENRGKTTDGQTFKVTSASNVKNMLYEIKARRPDNAKMYWHEILEEHSLFVVLRDDFFAGQNFKTFIDLEHFLRFQIPNKSPSFYQNGANFLVDLFGNAGLLKAEGNNLTLQQKDVCIPDIQQKPIDTSEYDEENTTNANQILRQIEPTKKNYSIRIKGPLLDVTVEVISEQQLKIVRSMLDMIEVEMQSKGDVAD